MKTYVKPEVRIENFTLSKHIAACAFDMKFTSADTCVGYREEYGDLTFFTKNNTDCSMTPSDINMYETTDEDYCYTNGSDMMTTFSS